MLYVAVNKSLTKVTPVRNFDTNIIFDIEFGSYFFIKNFSYTKYMLIGRIKYYVYVVISKLIA